LRQTGMGLNEQQLDNIKTLIKHKDTTEAYTLILGYMQTRSQSVLKTEEGLNEASMKLSTAWREYLEPGGKLFGTILEYINKALTTVLVLLPKVENAYKSWGTTILQRLGIIKKGHDDYTKTVVASDKKIEASNKQSLEAISAAEAKAAADKKIKTVEQLATEQAIRDDFAAKAKEKRDIWFKAEEERLKIKKDFEENNEKELQQYLKELRQGSWAAQLMGEKSNAEDRKEVEKSVHNFFDVMAGLQNSKNREMFEIGKQMAAINTTIKTYEAAMSVFTGMTSTIPGPAGVALGIAGSAAAVVMGLEQVSQIESQSMPQAAGGAYAPGDGATARFGEQGNPEWIMNQGNIKALARESSGKSQTTVNFQANNRTIQTVTVMSNQSQYRLKKEGRA
jgi:hypothetical protein